jgi:hypothetical protein
LVIDDPVDHRSVGRRRHRQISHEAPLPRGLVAYLGAQLRNQALTTVLSP